jgi:hypothetical protein
MWQPLTGREPCPRVDPVHSVVIYGLDPMRMRSVQVPGGWLRHGSSVRTRLIGWSQVGLCWCGLSHPVIDTWVAAGQRG